MCLSLRQGAIVANALLTILAFHPVTMDSVPHVGSG